VTHPTLARNFQNFYSMNRLTVGVCHKPHASLLFQLWCYKYIFPLHKYRATNNRHSPVSHWWLLQGWNVHSAGITSDSEETQRGKRNAICTFADKHVQTYATSPSCFHFSVRSMMTFFCYLLLRCRKNLSTVLFSCLSVLNSVN
jgi:hypothetical protein